MIEAADADTISTWPDGQIATKTRRYPTDLTNGERDLVAPALPRAALTGRPASVVMREVLNAIRYLARAGCGWRMLPNDFAREVFDRSPDVTGQGWASPGACEGDTVRCEDAT